MRVVGTQVAVHEADVAGAGHEGPERIDFPINAVGQQAELRRHRQERLLAPGDGVHPIRRNLPVGRAREARPDLPILAGPPDAPGVHRRDRPGVADQISLGATAVACQQRVGQRRTRAEVFHDQDPGRGVGPEQPWRDRGLPRTQELQGGQLGLEAPPQTVEVLLPGPLEHDRAVVTGKAQPDDVAPIPDRLGIAHRHARAPAAGQQRFSHPSLRGRENRRVSRRVGHTRNRTPGPLLFSAGTARLSTGRGREDGHRRPGVLFESQIDATTLISPSDQAVLGPAAGRGVPWG